MIYRQLFDHVAAGKTVRAGVIGTGQYATAVITQSAFIPRLDVPIAADLDVEAARQAYLCAGVKEDDITICASRGAALAAIEHGQRVVVADAMLLMDLPVDVIVEATGVPEAGAAHAAEAIRQGKHVAMVNKEADVTVGPILKHLADRAGVVYTAVDGDQHGLLMGLTDWARELGLEVLCGGKFRNGEVVYDTATGTVSGAGRGRT
ncbi:MAG: flagellar biosynthesis protein FlgA, partial [bacterium]|nr:flagellar biosynthesis protein FlgA [bacterium]